MTDHRKLPRTKKPDMNTQIGRYFLAKQKTKTKKEAAIMVGASPNHVSNVEATKTYRAIEEYYKDKLLNVISLADIASEHKKNILQDQDKGAKNKAIEMAVDKIEGNVLKDDSDDRVIVVLRS